MEKAQGEKFFYRSIPSGGAPSLPVEILGGFVV